MLHCPLVREQHRSGREHLHLDAIPIHFAEPHSGVPACGLNLAEKSIAHHDLRLARFGVIDPRPMWSTVARRQIGPSAREEMIMDVDDWHLRFAGMDRAAMLARAQALAAVELLKQGRQIAYDALQLYFRAMHQLMTILAI